MSTRALLSAIVLAATVASAKNPYLSLPNSEPVTHQFTGEEWDQERIGIDDAKEQSKRGPLTASVTTMRLEKMSWGEIYRISFETAPAASQRRIPSAFLLVTDSEILELSSDDMHREIRVIREMKKQPRFEKGDVVALSKGSLKTSAGMWKTEITVKDDTCKKSTWHDGSGHFSTLVWKKGAGLVEIAMGRGAELTGYELKRKLAK